MSRKKNQDLPKYCYARGNKIWISLKDQYGVWRNKRTPYTLDQADLAAQLVIASMRRIALKVYNIKYANNLEPEVVTKHELVFRRRTAQEISTKEGWIYAIALTPEKYPYHVKIGFTSTSVRDRLRAFRTACPNATVLGIWIADRTDERPTQKVICGRVMAESGRLTEAFMVSDIEAMLCRLDALLLPKPDDAPPPAT